MSPTNRINGGKLTTEMDSVAQNKNFCRFEIFYFFDFPRFFSSRSETISCFFSFWVIFRWKSLEIIKNHQKTTKKLKKREIVSLQLKKNLRKSKKWKISNLQKFLFWITEPISVVYFPPFMRLVGDIWRFCHRYSVIFSYNYKRSCLPGFQLF